MPRGKGCWHKGCRPWQLSCGMIPARCLLQGDPDDFNTTDG